MTLEYVRSAMPPPPAAMGMPGYLPLSARLDQLGAAIRQALDSTKSLTYYPQEDVPPMDSAINAEPTIIESVDEMTGWMAQLNARLARVNEVVGGRL